MKTGGKLAVPRMIIGMLSNNISTFSHTLRQTVKL